jgi:hypothetical protein
MNRRRGSIIAAGLIVLLAVTTAIAAARSPSAAGYRPVIAKPTTVPASPLAGKPFSVSYKVTRSDTGAPLVRGTMVCDPSIGGTVVKHVESFKAGIARLALVVPMAAADKQLKVRLTIRSGTLSTTRVTTFRVSGAETPAPTPTTPAPTPTTPATPTVPAPAGPAALTGQYCGFTGSGGGICFDVAGAGGTQYVANAKFQQTTNCEPSGRFRFTITFPGPVPITSDLKFTYLETSGELAGSKIDGVFDTAGNGKGSLWMKASFDYEGSHYSCTSLTDWTAKK